MAAPIFQPDLNGIFPSEVLALLPIGDNSLQSAFANYQPVSRAFVQTKPITASNKLILMATDNIYQPRIWSGEREENQLTVRSLDVVPVLYELTWGCDQLLWEDAGPQVGNVLQGIFQTAGNSLAAFIDSQTATAMAAGNTTVCYDGSNFFSATHPIDPENVYAGTWSNNIVNTPLTTENLAYMVAVFKQVPKKNGQIWSNRRKGLKLVVPTNLEFPARQAVQSSMIARAISEPTIGVSGVGPEDNTYLSMTVDDVIVLPELTDQTSCFLIDADEAAVTPFVFGERSPWSIVPMVAPTSPNVFNRHQFMWGATSRSIVAQTLPQNAMRMSAGPT